MDGKTFLDGDFRSGKGDCKYHCSPSCHPCQDGGESGTEWVYGCTHKAWPGNRRGDFVPIVQCGGVAEKCDMKGEKFIRFFVGGLTRRINNAEAKAVKLRAELEELKGLVKP